MSGPNNGTKVILKKEDCYCSIIQLYDNVWKALGHEPSQDDRYEPSKIWCSLNVMEQVEKYYKSVAPKNCTEAEFRSGFGMHWCNIGPKADKEFNDPDPEKFVVIVEPGWCYKEDE